MARERRWSDNTPGARPAERTAPAPPGGKTGFLATIVGVIVAADLATKLMIQSSLRLYEQVSVVGDYFRFTLIYNPGGAFGIMLGPYSRIIFLVLTAIVLTALLGMYWVTPERDRLRLTALAVVCGGAIGNLIDRIRSARGVVDFIDIGIGALRWPVFNIADIAVTTGAILLAISLWSEEDERA